MPVARLSADATGALGRPPSWVVARVVVRVGPPYWSRRPLLVAEEVPVLVALEPLVVGLVSFLAVLMYVSTGGALELGRPLGRRSQDS